MRVLRSLKKRRVERPENESRDTDRDWQLLGDSEPYFGVIMNKRFLRENLTHESKAEFLESGFADVDFYLTALRQHFGQFEPRSALDFGCGVGRLTGPLARLTGDAMGIDISDGMLAEAKLNVPSGAQFATAKPERLFDWIVSIIVFQHIPPERGYDIIANLAQSVAPGGCVTLQFAVWREAEHEHTAGTRVVVDQNHVRYVKFSGADRGHAVGHVTMYDYDLSRIVAILAAAGISQLYMLHTDHGGFYGVCLFARKAS